MVQPVPPEDVDTSAAGKAGPLAGRRIAVVYDCLFPYTVGGGERWYRNLAEALATAGADVTYLTRRQWDEPPRIPGISVVAVSGRSQLYDANGVRKLLPTVRFGAGLFRWLVRHRRDFDAIEVASFPFWSVLAVRLALLGRSVRVVVDWFELWSKEFWTAYAGRLVGTVGFQVQRLCLTLSPSVVVLSASNAERLAELGWSGRPLVLAGFLPEVAASPPAEDPATRAEPPFTLFVGRHIRDKGIDLLPDAFALVRKDIPDARLVVVGDGPMRPWLQEAVISRGLNDAVDVLGFVSDDDLQNLLSRAACLLAPSRREGYGIVVVDAMAKGTPVVTAGFPENLAVDHVEPANGRVADPTPESLAKAVVEVINAGTSLRRSCVEWYVSHHETKTVRRSTGQMVAWYAEDNSSGTNGQMRSKPGPGR